MCSYHFDAIPFLLRIERREMNEVESFNVDREKERERKRSKVGKSKEELRFCFFLFSLLKPDERTNALVTHAGKQKWPAPGGKWAQTQPESTGT